MSNDGIDILEPCKTDLIRQKPVIETFDITPEEVKQLKIEMDKASKFQKLMQSKTLFKGFNTYDTAFTLSSFLHPTVVSVLERNVNLIKKHNPTATISQVNMFRHKIEDGVVDSDSIHCTMSSVPSNSDCVKQVD